MHLHRAGGGIPPVVYQVGDGGASGRPAARPYKGRATIHRLRRPHCPPAVLGPLPRPRPSPRGEILLFRPGARFMPTVRHSLEPIFRPGSVAVVGASATPGSVGSILIRNLLGNP